MPAQGLCLSLCLLPHPYRNGSYLSPPGTQVILINMPNGDINLEKRISLSLRFRALFISDHFKKRRLDRDQRGQMACFINLTMSRVPGRDHGASFFLLSSLTRLPGQPACAHVPDSEHSSGDLNNVWRQQALGFARLSAPLGDISGTTDRHCVVICGNSSVGH